MAPDSGFSAAGIFGSSSACAPGEATTPCRKLITSNAETVTARRRPNPDRVNPCIPSPVRSSEMGVNLHGSRGRTAQRKRAVGLTG
ncbi:hypothetical protein GCM10010404_83400 [Nonomuraea africana]